MATATPAPGDARPLVLAVDVGGTKMAAGLVDGAGGLVARHQVPTAAGADAETLFGALAAIVGAALADRPAGADVVACGVGCGGPMTRGGMAVSPTNIGGWRGFPLHDRLAELTGRPTFVDNDAKALALGEGWVGAARGVRDFIGMVVSTGVGGGIVLDGRLLDGADSNAGHIGHVIVEPDGHECGCGAIGCLEAEASGTGLTRILGRSPVGAPPEVVARAGRMVGRAVASVANLLDLRLAVIAGSVALGFGEPFFAAAQAELDERARLDFARGAVVRPAGLGADGPLVGAGAVGWRGLGVDVLGHDTQRQGR